MQTLPFWNSIKEGLPALVHKIGSKIYSEDVLATDADGDLRVVKLCQCGPTDALKLGWLYSDGADLDIYCITTFTHWAYIPAVPKKEKE